MGIAEEVAALASRDGGGPTRYAATVTRAGADGSVWVSVLGGADETPCIGTFSEVSPGDSVEVEIRDGRAYVVGNSTSPAASGRSVEAATDEALKANEMASRALSAAGIAETAAASAQESAAKAEVIVDTLDEMAEESGKTVEQILQDAGTAGTAAAQAQESADKAVYALSDVERVVGTVNWIAEHGEYVNQAGEQFDSSKVYYTRSGTAPNYVYTVVAEPVAADIASYYVLRIDESVQNFLASHIWMDTYGLNLSVDSANGYRIHQGTVDGQHSAGMYILDGFGNIVAKFGADGAQIGKVGESHVELDYHSMQLVDKEGDTYLHVSDLRDHDGKVMDTFTADGTTTRFVLSVQATGSYAVYVDDVEVTTGVSKTVYYFTFGSAPAASSVVKAYYTATADAKAYTLGRRGSGAIGMLSVVEGDGSRASGLCSHAEGFCTKASGTDSHAEGAETIASDMYAHAEGTNTRATAYASHAEGGYTVAAGFYSHAQNMGAYTGRWAQTAIGTYNVKDVYDPSASEPDPPTTHPSGDDNYGQYAVIIGNGTSDSARSNALAVRWNGIVDDVNAVPGSVVPIGSVIDYAGSTVPSGYLECNGQAVSRTTYALLFAAIGTTWGAGDGSTTFNLPDFRGRVSIGAGTGTAGGATAHSMASYGGDERMQAHSHGNTIKATTPKFTHSITQPVFALPNHRHGPYNSDGYNGILTHITDSSISQSAGFTKVTSGNREWIKYTNTGNPTSNPNCTRSTNVGVGDHAATDCTMSGSVSSEGSGAAGNMQPFATLRKIIRAV